MTARFWDDHNLEPKRKFRFTMNVGGIDHIFVKSAAKPQFEVGITPHDYLNHEFKFPGKIKWTDIDVTVVEDTDNEAMKKLLGILSDSGYNWMQNSPQPPRAMDLSTISKRRAVNALSAGNGKGCRLDEIDSDANVICTYNLHNAWVSKCAPSENSYSDEELSEIVLTITYDFAIIDIDPTS